MKRKLLNAISSMALVVMGCGLIVFLCGPEILPFPVHTRNQWLKVLGAKSPPSSRNFLKHRLNQWRELFNGNTNIASEILRLKEITSRQESEAITFEVPILYDLLAKRGFLTEDCGKGTNGSLHLICSDGFEFSTSPQSVSRAANGNCLITWDTSGTANGSYYISNGTYHIQLELSLFGRAAGWHTFRTTGPSIAVSLSRPPDICRIDWSISDLNFKGIILYASLTDSNATYSIELQTTNGALIKTITGNTTNGIINERWDLTDYRGNKYSNSTVNAMYHVTLTNSFSQTKSQLYHIEFP